MKQCEFFIALCQKNKKLTKRLKKILEYDIVSVSSIF